MTNKSKKKTYSLEDEVLIEYSGVLKVNLTELGINHYIPKEQIERKILQELVESLNMSAVGISPVLSKAKVLNNTAETRSVLTSSDEEDNSN
jgi:hypothetical protein